jgi:hypothetical protein
MGLQKEKLSKEKVKGELKFNDLGVENYAAK